MSNLRLQSSVPDLHTFDAGEAVRASGLKAANERELIAAHRLAAARIGPEVVSAASLAKIHAKCGAAVLVHVAGGEVAGALGMAPLSRAGHVALLAGALDLATPRLDQIAGAGERATALYAMGIAAADHAAARAVVGGVVRLRHAFGHLPFYARAVTPEGRRVLIERLGCADLGEGLFHTAAYDVTAAAA